MIAIDFQAGSHGNYLEFVCNMLAGRAKGIPFNAHGAAHLKTYVGAKAFISGHYSFNSPSFKWPYQKIISVQIGHDDLLPLQQISLFRAGDHQLDNNVLEKDTFNKLNNEDYKWMLDRIVDAYFRDQVRDSYLAVKDPAWPTVNNYDDYNKLPQWIKLECESVHKLMLLELSDRRPDCPRHILRNFFQIGFKRPEEHGFIINQNKIKYPQEISVFIFPYENFYHTEKFLHSVKQIADWAGIVYNNNNEIADLHEQFLARQPYKDSKAKCDALIEQIKNNTAMMPLNLNLIEEAYINAKLGKDFFV